MKLKKVIFLNKNPCPVRMDAKLVTGDFTSLDKHNNRSDKRKLRRNKAGTVSASYNK